MDFSYATCHLSLSLLLAVSMRLLHSSSQTETFPPGASIKTGPCLICCAIKWDMLPFMQGYARFRNGLVGQTLPSFWLAGRCSSLPAGLELFQHVWTLSHAMATLLWNTHTPMNSRVFPMPISSPMKSFLTNLTYLWNTQKIANA